MSAINSFQARVKSAINNETYHSSMRRSIQALVLYEADRCLKDRYSSLKPFQQKYALLATATDLLEAFDFLDESAKEEIMFRGNARKALGPVQAWRRMKSITKDLDQTFLPKAKVLLEDEVNHEKSHDEICEMLLQSMYEEKSSEATKPRPPMWEYNRSHTFVVYRVYFRELALDTDLIPATPPRVVDVPDKKPADFRQAPLNATSVRGTDEAVADAVSDEQRRMLKELKHRIAEYLGSFEGVIAEDELKKRQNMMYAKLRPGRLIIGAKNKKQQQKKKNAEAMGAGISEDVTEPLTDEDYENVCSNGAKRQQRKAMREARRGGAKKQQKKAEWDENMAKVEGEDAVTDPPTTDEGWEKKWARLERAKKQQKRAMRQAKRGGAKQKKVKEMKAVIKPETMDDV